MSDALASVEVPPRLAGTDHADGSLADSELLGYLSLGRRAGSDVSGVIVSQLRRSIGFAGIGSTRASVALSPPFDRIADVLGVRSRSEMRGLDAGGGVAAVQDVKPVGDGADEFLVGDTVGEVLGATAPDSSVALLVGCAAPKPARPVCGGCGLHDEVEGSGTSDSPRVSVFTHGAKDSVKVTKNG